MMLGKKKKNKANKEEHKMKKVENHSPILMMMMIAQRIAIREISQLEFTSSDFLVVHGNGFVICVYFFFIYFSGQVF